MLHASKKTRTSLAEKATKLLKHNAHVIEIIPYGSLADGRADQYSDIDLHVVLKDITDRDFAETVPELLHPIGPYIIDSWGPTALPDRFIRVLYFYDYSLFWHVDIWCENDLHADGSDLKSAFHRPFMFRVWIDELKKILSGDEKTAVMDRFAGEWMAPSGLSGDLKKRMPGYLDRIYRYVISKGAPCDDLYSRCSALCREYIKTGTIIKINIG